VRKISSFDAWDFLYAGGIAGMGAGAWGKWGLDVAGLVVGAILIVTALIGSGVIRLEGKVRRGNIDERS
jgi:hypothetical protein